jgi:hypothetical protein
MSPQRLALLERKLQLVHESGQLRERFGARAQSLQPLFAGTDQVRKGWRWLRSHPEVWVTAGVALLVARPRRLWRWGSKAWVLWLWGRRLKGWAQPTNPAKTTPLGQILLGLRQMWPIE